MGDVENLDEFVRQVLATHGYAHVKPLILVLTQTTTVTHTFAPSGDETTSQPVSTSGPETVLRIEVGDAAGAQQARFLLTASADSQGALTLTALQAL